MPEEISVKEMFKNIQGGKRSFGKAREKWQDDVGDWRKKRWGQKRLQIDPEGGQGPAWTVEPVEEKKNSN